MCDSGMRRGAAAAWQPALDGPEPVGDAPCGGREREGAGGSAVVREVERAQAWRICVRGRACGV